MKEVYIEVVILQNIAVDLFIIIISSKLSRIRVKKKNALLALIFGVIAAVFLPLIKMNAILRSIIKTLCGIVISLICSPSDRRWLFCMTFYAVTFVIGGICELFTLSAMWVSLVAFILVLLSDRASKIIYKNKNIGRNIVNVTLINGKNKVEAFGLWDSGNCAYYKGKPVCFICKKKGIKLIDNVLKMQTLIIKTAAGESKIKVFEIEKLIIKGESENIINNVMIGITKHKLGFGCDVILHTELMK